MKLFTTLLDNAPMLSATKDKDSGVSPFLFKWTIRETMELIKGIQKYGAGNWLNIMEDDEFKKAFPLRNTSTNAYLRDRWKTLARRGNEPPTVAELEEAERHLGADNYNFLGWINDQREKVCLPLACNDTQPPLIRLFSPLGEEAEGPHESGDDLCDPGDSLG